MKKLVLNPKKIFFEENNENIFLFKYYLNFFNKTEKEKIKFSIIHSENFNIDEEIKKIKYNEKISEDIFCEVFPELNRLHNINWSYKAWKLFIGNWITSYVTVVLDRISLIEPVLNSDIDYKDHVITGENVSLITYDLRDFTYSSNTILWNEKLFSRLLYIFEKKIFDNKPNLLTSSKIFKTVHEGIVKNIIYKIKIKILKIIERLTCSKNKFLFFNSYIADKLKLLAIFKEIKDTPFLYSLAFFNNKLVKEGVDLNLRKKIILDYKNDDLKIKILKFLIVESMPSIYLEGFKKIKKLSDQSHLPKKKRIIFTSSIYADNIFKYWVSEKINEDIKIVYGQHGSSYGMQKELFSEKNEIDFCNKFFTWGWSKKNSKIIPIGNFLINTKLKNKKKKINKKLLLVSPALAGFKRLNDIFDHENFEDIVTNSQKILDNIKLDLVERINIKKHPQNIRRDVNYEDLIHFNDKKIKYLNKNINFNSAASDHSLIIFPTLSTEFFKQLSLNKPCMIYLSKNYFNHCILDEYKEDFNLLKEIGILHTSGDDLAKKLNTILLNIDKWWYNKEVNRIKDNFCSKHSNLVFDPIFFANELKKIN